MRTKSLFFMALVFLMTSCVKTKNYYVEDNNREWFIDTANSVFIMRDDNDVSYSFRLEPVWQNMLENGMSVLGIPLEKSMHEELIQNGGCSISSYLKFCLNIEAYKLEPENKNADLFMMYLGDAEYVMHIDGDQFYPIGCYDTGQGVGTMEFEIEYLNGFRVHDTEYQGVMHLKLIDLAYPQSRFFPTEIYYAKHYGLIQCTLDDKLTLYRLPD